jgi:hypothetical protein
MCVMFCANPKVHVWLDITLARTYRETLQLCAICPPVVTSGEKTLAVGCSGAKPQAAVAQLDKASETRVMKRSAWIQAYCQHMASVTQHSPSAQEWHKTFDLIAKAWGRLLSLVGLRW